MTTRAQAGPIAWITAGTSAFAGSPFEFAAQGTVSGALVNGGLCDATSAAFAGKVVLCGVGKSGLIGQKVGSCHDDDSNPSVEAELSRGKFVAPATLARHLMIIINGLIITQLVHRDASYGDDALGMIATLLAAARGIS